MKIENESQKREYHNRFYAILPFDSKKLREELKRFGLDYQKVKGLWKDEKIIVWRTAYMYMSFKAIMLELCSRFKQKTLCLGRKQGEQYDVRVYQYDETCWEKYKMTEDYLVDTAESPVSFGKCIHNVCLESADCPMGVYKKDQLTKCFCRRAR